MVFESAGERLGGKLGPLIGVEDFRRAETLQGLFQRLDTEVRIQRVRHVPRQHPARMPVHDGHQVHEPSGHREVADVARPDLVRPFDSQIPEQVRVALVSLPGLARSASWIQSPQIHLTHQTLDPLAVDHVAAIFQFVADLPTAVKRPLQVDLVDQPHQHQFCLADRLGTVVRARSVPPRAIRSAASWAPYALCEFVAGARSSVAPVHVG